MHTNIITMHNYYIIIILFILCIIIFVYFKNKIYGVKYMDSHYVDDVTKLNKTLIEHVFCVNNAKEIVHIIKFANKKNMKVIARGESHSMGGHTIAPNGFIIDMKKMNHILNLDRINNIVTVESGITWLRLIYFLNKYGYSPEILQSYASFSVGGSISVNVHGITSNNSLCKSIIEIELINSKGEFVTCSRKINKQLFSLVIGGYGLFGIITKVKLKFIDNKSLIMNSINTNVNEFPNLYTKFLHDKKIDIKIARINIVNMDEINLYVFTRSNPITKRIISHIEETPKDMSTMSKIIYKWMLPNPKVQKIRFNMETKMGKPFDFANSCTTRNEFLYETATPLASLYSPFIDINKTHILQEYFIPDDIPDNFEKWMTYLKEIFIINKCNLGNVNLLNVTIRYVVKDTDTFLKYSNKNMYAFVFYYRIDMTMKGDEELKEIHNLLTNKALELGGTFYLPYRHHYTYSQLKQAYTNIDEFFELKKNYDEKEIFWNMWYGNYGPKIL